MHHGIDLATERHEIVTTGKDDDSNRRRKGNRARKKEVAEESVDARRRSWKSAVKKEGTPWTHLSCRCNLRGF